MRKVIVNGEVRSLLKELDDVMSEYHGVSRLLASRELRNSQVMDLSSTKQGLTIKIVGVAYRLNEASIRETGRIG